MSAGLLASCALAIGAAAQTPDQSLGLKAPGTRSGSLTIASNGPIVGIAWLSDGKVPAIVPP